ncbi:uncharacterized protein LOC113470972 [Diaphorina citri]|uniref:Uncharacterized protein LOC113470972 n=1 Tax=Diaphorina citri TaxID=121845 RepID=A0A3Q0JAX2_DIACI|nr:uncharacterized protein LOC113470972 [Diaphorina citri]
MSSRNNWSTPRGVTISEILDALEADELIPDGTERILFLTPPVEDGNNTDIDIDLSDDEHEGNLNHLGSKLSSAECELRLNYTDGEFGGMSSTDDIIDRPITALFSSHGTIERMDQGEKNCPSKYLVL